MFYYGGGPGSSCGCGMNTAMPFYGGGACGGGSNFAIVLVLFILLVIVICPRFCF